MKCDNCNGRGCDACCFTGGVIGVGKDSGNLQLRLDHNFQPVVDDVPERKLNAFIEGKPVSDAEARQWAMLHPNMLMPMQASEQNMNPGPGLSTPPRRCNKYLRLEGKPYPRSCAECGIGPCKWPLQPGSVPVSKVTPLKMQPPTAVQDRDAAIAQVHAEFAKAGLCIVPVEVLRDAADVLNHGDEVEQLRAEKELRKHLPKE